MSSSLIQKIATLEVPVSDLDRSIQWFTTVLGLELKWKGADSAMIRLPEDTPPNIYLVRTESPDRLKFQNTNTGVRHSVIDFFTEDLAGLHAHLTERGATVTALKAGARGFGLKDPDGNLFGVTDIRPES